MLDSEIKIPVIKINSSASFPFVVQGKVDDSWQPFHAVVSLTAALEKARALMTDQPGMPTRIEHHVGPLLISDTLPEWKTCESGQLPLDVALWTGSGPPPAIGTTVTITVNDIGPGVVTGFAVQQGWLGVMVQAHEDSRPLWHKKENPDNLPALAFGTELRLP